jgi:hypothetical protein
VQALLPWAARFAAQHRCAYALVDWHGEGGKDLRIGLGRRSAGNLKHVFVRVAIVGHGGDWQLLVNLPFAPRLFAEFNGQPTIDGTARTVVRLQRDELARLTHLAALAYRAQLAS